MEDPELGHLEWMERVEMWTGAIRLSDGSSCRLYLLARAAFTPDRTITPQARAAIARLVHQGATSRKHASADLLEICNDEWNQGPPLTVAEFEALLIPSDLSVHESGYAEFGFAPMDLFGGHGVTVRFQASGEYQEVSLDG